MSDSTQQLTRDELICRATDRLRSAMRLANDTAEKCGHDKINSLHILNGLLREGGAWASLTLKSAGLNSVKLMSSGRDGAFDSADVVFDRACDIANRQKDFFLSTDHVLLAVLDGTDSITETLGVLGVDVGKLRTAFSGVLDGHFPLPVQPHASPSSGESPIRPAFDRDKACRQFVDGLLLRVSWDKCQPLDVHGPILGKVAVEKLCKLAETLKANGESWEEYT